MIFKQFSLSLITILVLFMFGCEDENNDICTINPGLVDCIGFPSLNFIITRNGENIFNENETTIQDIAIQGDDALNGELNLQSGFDSTNGSILFFSDSDWILGGNHTYIITVEDTDSFSLNTSFTISEGPCCGGIPILERIEVNDIQVEQDLISGFYIISLD